MASPCPPSLPLLPVSFSSTSGQAAVAGQGSVGWEGVEGKKRRRRWRRRRRRRRRRVAVVVEFWGGYQLQSPGHSKRKKRERFDTKCALWKKKSLNQISSVSLSLSITLSPSALLNSIKESSGAGRRRGEGGWRFREKQGKEEELGEGREDGEGKDFNIWFPHLKYINLSYPGALLKPGRKERKGWEEAEEKGRGHLWHFHCGISFLLFLWST